MGSYSGFYIDKPLGNNLFSFEERKIKSIFVPELIDGKIDDVKIGDTVSFCEVEDGIEFAKKGLAKFVFYKWKDKPVYIFDNHNHAFYFWCRELEKGNLKMNTTLVHIDQHKDTRVPENYNVDIYNIDDVFSYTNFTLNVGNFIKPALEKKIFDNLIIMDSTYSFEYEVEGDYSLDIDLDIFSDEMDYIDESVKLGKIKELIENAQVITIATSPYFIQQEKAIEYLRKIFG